MTGDDGVSTWRPAAMPDNLWNALPQVTLPEEQREPQCRICSKCKCKEQNRYGYCKQCLQCGCWASGRFGRGPFGQALLDVEIQRVESKKRWDVLHIERLDLPCKVANLQDVEKQQGFRASVVYLQDGLATVLPWPAELIARVDGVKGGE